MLEELSQKTPISRLILLIVVILLILGLGILISYYYFVRSSQPSETTQTITTPSISTSTTTTDETAGWETYTNEALGFSFKYPPRWIKAGTNNNEPEWLKNGDYLYLKSTTQDYPDKNFPLDGLISISTLNNPRKLSLQEIFDKDYQECLKSEEQEIGSIGCPGMDTSKWKKITIDGKATFRSGESGRPEAVPMDEVYIDLGNEYLIIGLSYYNYSNNNIGSEMASDFEKILSTIKFTK